MRFFFFDSEQDGNLEYTNIGSRDPLLPVQSVSWRGLFYLMVCNGGKYSCRECIPRIVENYGSGITSGSAGTTKIVCPCYCNEGADAARLAVAIGRASSEAENTFLMAHLFSLRLQQVLLGRLVVSEKTSFVTEKKHFKRSTQARKPCR